MIKKIFFLIALLFVVEMSTASNTPPQISNFRIEVGQPDKIYFDSDVPLNGSTVTGFDLIDKEGLSIDDVVINSGGLTGHYFIVSSSFKWYHNNVFKYDGGSDITDMQGNALPDFSLQYIKNNLPIPDITGSEYYVNLDGDDSNDGLTEASAFRTIQKGIDVAKAGDIVWIKAGYYGDENLKTRHSGKVDKPIVFEGYKDTPGDITRLYYSYGDGDLNSDEIPLIDGENRRRGTGLVLKESLNFIIFKNLQIQNYQTGITIGNKTKKVILERVICKDFGTSGQVGVGFALNFFNNSYLRLNECFGLNGSEGVYKINGSNNLLDGCKAFGDEYDRNNPQGLSPDYYLELQTGSGSIVRNMHIERKIDKRDAHTGHAYSVRYNSNFNLFENNVSVNIGYNMTSRDLTCTGNVWRNMEAYNGVRGIICDGDSNVYENLYIHDTRYAIVMQEGTNSIFRNIVVNNTDYFIYADEDGSYSSDNIKFYNLTINKVNVSLIGRYNYKVNQTYSAIEIKNSIISNCATKEDNGITDDGFIWDTNNFYNTWGVEGSDAFNIEPLFVDKANGDFHLQADSPMVDKGTTLESVSYDKDMHSRPQGDGYDLGAFEFQNIGSQDVSLGEDVEICSGSTETLTAFGAGEFLWNTGETTQSITVTPTETTIYSVTLTNESGRISSDSLKVVVLELPTADAGEDVIICSGSETILTASGGDSYLWSTGETTQSITINPTETTIYIVTTTNDGCSNTAEGQVTVTVEAAIDLSVSNDVEICNGETVVLTAEGADNYLWNTGETTASITVNPSENTTYTVSLSNGECTVSKEITVTVNEVPTVNAGDDVLICNGENIELTATGTGNFIWNTGETTSSIIVSPSSTTTYTVSSSSPCGDQVSDDVIVTVNDIPALNIGKDVEICEGDTITLTATGADNYEWSTGETTASITVTPVTTTTYTVSSSNGKCLISDELTVTVNKKLTVNAGNDISICEGEKVILTASGTGVFVWSTGETNTSITVSPTTTTTYTVSSSDSCGDVSDQVTVFVYSLPSINAGNDVTITGGETVTLTATGSGNYLWSTGETTQSITVNPRSTTTYSVSVTSSEGCKNNDNVVVTVENEEVVANAGEDVEICKDSNTTLSASGGDDFLWSTGETTQSIVVSPNETTTYSVTVSNTTSLDTDEVVVTVDQTCSGIANRSVEKQTLLYPNPTNGILNLRMSGYTEAISIAIINMNGSILFSQIITNYSSTKRLIRKLDLSAFSKGMYFVRIENKQNVQIQKVILY